MSKLNLYSATHTDVLSWPDKDEEITLSSSALKIFTDFKHSKPLILSSTTKAIDAQEIMIKSRIRLEIVVDDKNHFVGIVSLQDMSNQEVIKKVSEGEKRDELTVAQFMKPRSSLKVFKYSELEKASIKDVIDALKDSGHHHFLVTDNENDSIRGIVSTSDITRLLEIPPDFTRDSSFVSIYNSIRH